MNNSNFNNNTDKARGQLKIFIGYAPGVGKTYTMLNEATRRVERGEDVVIGYIETYQRKDTISQIGNLEIIPRKAYINNELKIEEMDVEAILKRHPSTVIIDELAYTNSLNCKNKKRYEDVEEILRNGINVITTLNIQHLESLNDIIKKITGLTVNDTIPDYIVNNADEIVVVDITPEALQNRLKRGNIYPADKIDYPMTNFFRKGNLNALREIALRQTAEEVDEELDEYMKQHGIVDTWQTVEKLMICITPLLIAKKLIRRGARMAKRYKCDWIVVNVSCTNVFARKYTQKELDSLDGHYNLAKQLGAEVINVQGKSVSTELSKLAVDKHITQIVLGHSNRTPIETILRGSTINRLLKKSKNIEIHVIPS